MRTPETTEPDWVRERKAAGMPHGERRVVRRIAVLFALGPLLLLAAFFGFVLLALWLLMSHGPAFGPLPALG